jgi:serine/threonine protein kinase
LVLEFCQGGNLQQLISYYKKLQEPLARVYMCEMQLALEHLHVRNIIFRDLKPDNIVLDGHGHAYLTDFGLSKEGVQVELGNKATSFCGSVAYLAPEMIKRQGEKRGREI